MSDKNYDIVIDGEPKEVTEIRHKILETFKDLEFVEDGHHYYLNGEEIVSVTNVIHQFEEEVNFDEKAVGVAEKRGVDVQVVLDEWKINNLKSTILGTRVHAYGESLGWVVNGHPELIVDEIMPQYYAERNWLIPIHKKEEAITKFIKDLPSSYHLVLNETKVYSGLNSDTAKNPKTKYCGTFDSLYWYDGGGDPNKAGLVIFDYKNNASLTKEFSRSKGVYLKEPFSNMYAEPQSLYALQLSAYSVPLQDLGYKVLGRKLIWVKDNGEYEKIDLPDFSDVLREVL